jgi:hypothetical protein
MTNKLVNIYTRQFERACMIWFLFNSVKNRPDIEKQYKDWKVFNDEKYKVLFGGYSNAESALNDKNRFIEATKWVLLECEGLLNDK